MKINIERYNLYTLVFCLVLLTGCQMNRKSSDITATDFTLDSIVFFGHQSIGDNILEGVSDVSKRSFSIIPIEKVISGDTDEEAVFVHEYIGRNGYPLEKIDHFKKLLIEWPVEVNPDIAMMKFCYVDFTPETDVNWLFSEYKKAIQTIEEQKPKLLLVHMTVPLTAPEPAVKYFLKNLLGREPWEYRENLVREQFNTQVRKEYQAGGYLFDLARSESVNLKGKYQTFTYKGETGIALRKDYTYDSAHLNKFGSRQVANDFLIFLGSIQH